MGKYNVNLSWWQTLLAITVLFGLIGYRYVDVQSSVDDVIKDKIHNTLYAQYASAELPGIQRDFMAGDEKAIEDKVAVLTEKLTNIEFPSITARGLGKEIYVRARISVNGEAPPDGKEVRYFLFKRSDSSAEWVYAYESNALGYYMELF